MYSRDTTLDTVKRVNYDLVYKFFNENHLIDRDNLKKELSPLLTSKKYALFHVAIVSENRCSENTSHYYNRPFLCDTFKDAQALKNILKINEQNSSILEVETSALPNAEFKSESYLVQKLGNSNEWLIAKTNYYSKNSELSHFIYFITKRYYQANGFNSIVQKGKYMFFIVLLISFIIWYLNMKKNQFYHNRYQKSKKIEADLQEKWKKIDEDYNKTKNEHYEKELEIIKLETKLKDESEQEQAKLHKIIKELQSNKIILDKRLKEQEKQIAEIEKDEIEQRNTSNKRLEKLDQDEIKLEHKKVHNKIDQLELLWRHEPSWNDRKMIETLVALQDTHLPFTITQGFIAFDKLIFELVKKSYPNIDEKETNLYTNINIIFDNNLLPQKYKNDVHNIRVSRNKWFHAGIYPPINVIDHMISILQSVNAKPII